MKWMACPSVLTSGKPVPFVRIGSIAAPGHAVAFGFVFVDIVRSNIEKVCIILCQVGCQFADFNIHIRILLLFCGICPVTKIAACALTVYSAILQKLYSYRF